MPQPLKTVFLKSNDKNKQGQKRKVDSSCKTRLLGPGGKSLWPLQSLPLGVSPWVLT